MKQDNADSVLINQTASNYFSVLSMTAANNFLRFIFSYAFLTLRLNSQHTQEVTLKHH